MRDSLMMLTRLGAIQADRADEFLQPLLAEIEHLLRRIGDREQGRCRAVDADIGRLRRQHDRDQQRIGVDELEFGLRDRPARRQPAIEFLDFGLCERARRLRLVARGRRRDAARMAWRAASPASYLPGMSAGTDVFFERVLLPHRSLPPRGFHLLMLGLGLVSLAVGIGFVRSARGRSAGFSASTWR